MNINEEKVYGEIEKTVRELKEAHRMPYFVPYSELLKKSGLARRELNDVLNALYKQKRIRVCNGLNEKLIAIKDEK